MSILLVTLLVLGMSALGVYVLRRPLLARALKLPPARYRVRTERNLAVPMRAGVTLTADHYVPQAVDSYPTILIRSPWRKPPFNLLYLFIGQRFAERGYHVVIQHTREVERGLPHPYEANDGQDALAWVAQQPWFNGQLGLWGASILGYAQWAVVAHAPTSLKAMMPITTASRWSQLHYPGGVFALDTTLQLRGVLLSTRQPLIKSLLGAKQRAQAMQAAFNHLPACEADTVAFGQIDPDYGELVRHPPADAFWQAIDHRSEATPSWVQPHLIAGWYDLFLPAQLADYATLRANGHIPYLTIGPWHHTALDLGWVSVREGLAWFDAQLKDDRSRLRTKPVRVYVMGAETWREFDEWPPAANQQRLFLHPQRLATNAPSVDSPPDRYRYDPANPTPTIGGAVINNRPGQQDNRIIEQRADVVCYTSEPLAADLDIIGAPWLELYIHSTLEHTDFFGRLCDVTPDGRSLSVCDGLLRVEPGVGEAQPDGTRLLTIDLWATAYRFARGHCMRLQISSGAHPRWIRNLGTGQPFAEATTMCPADQTIYHDHAHPSALVLPEISRNGRS